MADRKRIKRSIKQLQAVKTWQLVILLILSLLISATFLRLNNIGMIERREAVKGADASGDTEDMQNRLYDLQRYVSAHMNTSTGRVALEKQYERDSQRVKEAAVDDSDGASAQRAAMAVCDPLAKANGWRWPDPRYISCVDRELSKFSSTTGEVTIKLPDEKLYYHEFTAPVWSPDFAGWSVLVSGAIALMILVRLVSLLVLRVLLRRHYLSI